MTVFYEDRSWEKNIREKVKLILRPRKLEEDTGNFHFFHLLKS